jgi:hypothetical protein
MMILQILMLKILPLTIHGCRSPAMAKSRKKGRYFVLFNFRVFVIKKRILKSHI